MGKETGSRRSAGLPPGFDEEDPYEGETLDEYPEWWQKNIETFREFEMRPYRPPRFSDGVFVPEVVSSLQEELSVEIAIRTKMPSQESESWEIIVDDQHVRNIRRVRDPDGYSLYEISSDDFADSVRDTA